MGKPQEENHAQARERLVTALLASGWQIHTYRARGQRPLPELRHKSKPYALSFYGHSVQQSGMATVRDCRGWPLSKLLRFCDRLPTEEDRVRYLLKKARAEARAGLGIPHKEAMAQIRAGIRVWFDERRPRPKRIPRFRIAANEQAFWKKNSVLDYFAESDILERFKSDGA